MRSGIINGNGAICDKCYTDVYPKDIRHIITKVLHPDINKASTGHTVTIGKMDLCPECYEELQRVFLEFKKPRKKANDTEEFHMIKKEEN